MPDHVHVWRLIMRFDGVEYSCGECGDILSRGEIECRLNATERLSAETAGGWLMLLREEGYDSAALAAYAAALEGKDA